MGERIGRGTKVDKKSSESPGSNETLVGGRSCAWFAKLIFSCTKVIKVTEVKSIYVTFCVIFVIFRHVDVSDAVK